MNKFYPILYTYGFSPAALYSFHLPSQASSLYLYSLRVILYLQLVGDVDHH